MSHFYRAAETKKRIEKTHQKTLLQAQGKLLKAEVSHISTTCDWITLSGLAAL